MSHEHVNELSESTSLIGLSDFVDRYRTDLGGVGLSAVTNWRNRFEDFPEPRGQSRRPQYFVEAELIEWAVRHGKMQRSTGPSGPGPLEVAHAALTAVGVDDPHHTVAFAISVLAYAESQIAEAGPNRDRQHVALVRDALASPATEQVKEAQRLLSPDLQSDLTESLRSHGSTPTSLRSEFAHATGDQGYLDDPLTGRILVAAVQLGGSIHDPCCGSGLLLQMIGSGRPHTSRTEITGREVDPYLAAAAGLLLATEGLAADIICESSLSGPPNRQYETVIADPPSSVPAELAGGPPEDGSGERHESVSQTEWPGLWATAVLEMTAPKGSAGVVAPTRWLMAKGGNAANTRRRLLDAGVLEAVIRVPTPTNTRRVGTTVILVLRGTRPAFHRGVLVIDVLSERPPRSWDDPSDNEISMIESVRDVMTEWRQQSGPTAGLPRAGHSDLNVTVVSEQAARAGYFFDLNDNQLSPRDGELQGLTPPPEFIPRRTIADLVPDKLIVTSGKDPGAGLPDGSSEVVVLQTSGPRFGAVTIVPRDQIPRKSRGIVVFAVPPRGTGTDADDGYSLEFIAAWLSSEANQDHLSALGAGGTQQSRSASLGDVLRLSAEFPERGDRERISRSWKDLAARELKAVEELEKIRSERRRLT